MLSFLSLPDLIRSKETEREKDWQDVAVLEEIHDNRLFNQVVADAGLGPDVTPHVLRQTAVTWMLMDGYDVVTTPLPSFLRSGGSAFCLTLRLDRRSVPIAAVAQDAAVA